MKILIISDKFPTPDRNSGELRFFTILKLLAINHEVFFHSYLTHEQTKAIGKDETKRYKKDVGDLGITILDEHIKNLLPTHRFECVFFEFYNAARRHLDKVRYWQPNTIIIVDSVDVHFKRLLSQAQLTGRKEDFGKARRMKKRELSAYNKADVVITVTEPDKLSLLQENSNMHIEIIPNIHDMEPLKEINDVHPSLVFVGGFNHPPNVDAILYFHQEIFPLIKKRIPDVTLEIVGYSPPQEVLSLASQDINVTGFVPDTKPYLLANRVSIAPLRYGAGMKGKIGEAMSYGLPVVTTSIGSEGFGLTHGENVLVADAPEDFADHVIQLLNDRVLYDKIRKNAWEFIDNKYSCSVVENSLVDLFDRINKLPVKKMGLGRRAMFKISVCYDKYIKRK